MNLNNFQQLVEAFAEPEWDQARIDEVNCAIDFLHTGDLSIDKHPAFDRTGDANAAWELIPDNVEVIVIKRAGTVWQVALAGHAGGLGDLAFSLCHAWAQYRLVSPIS